MKKKVKELGIKRVRVNSSGCLNRCKLGPVLVVYPEGKWYKVTKKEEVDTLINDLLINKKAAKNYLIED